MGEKSLEQGPGGLCPDVRRAANRELDRAREAIRAECGRQGRRTKGLEADAGLADGQLARWLAGPEAKRIRGRNSIQLDSLLRVLRVLGRDLAWLGREVAKREVR